MGLGKTRTAATAWALLGRPKCLVVCPALTRYEWTKEFARLGEEVGTILHKPSTSNLPKQRMSAHVSALAARVKVVSYELVKEFSEERPDFVIVDEIHRLQNPKSGFTKSLKLLCNSAKAVVGLTGTLIPTETANLYGVLDAIWDGRFGTPWTFNHRYTNAHHNGYGWSFRGTNPAFEDELRYRLSCVSTRVTRGEIASALPPIKVAVITTAAEINPETQVFLTHKRKTAQDHFPDQLAVTGEFALEKRLELIDTYVAEGRKFAATMNSIEEGINNLGSLRKVCFLELSWRPKTIVQTIGRFSRLGGAPTTVEVQLLVKKGSPEERIALALEQRFANIDSLIRNGAAGDAVSAAFEIDEEKFLQDLNLALDSTTEGDANEWF